LAVAAPLLCLPAAVGVYIFLRNNKITKTTIVFLMVIAAVSGSAYYIDSCLKNPPINFNVSAIGDYRYEGSDQKYSVEHADNILASGNEIAIYNFQRHHHKMTAIFHIKNGGMEGAGERWIEFPVYNFPGYAAVLNGGDVLPIVNGNNNFVRVLLPSNSDYAGSTLFISLKYKGLKRFFIGNIISAITILFLIGNFYKSRFKR
jgi:hypothetical protein